MKGYVSVLSHQACDHLLQQPQEVIQCSPEGPSQSPLFPGGYVPGREENNLLGPGATRTWLTFTFATFHKAFLVMGFDLRSGL